MSLRDIFSTRSRQADVDDTRHADRADIAAFNEARSDAERYRVIDSVRARKRASSRG